MKEIYNLELVSDLIKISLREDCYLDDITSKLALKNPDKKVNAIIYSKDDFILCGTPLINLIVEFSGFDIKVDILRQDGERLSYKDEIAKLSGSAINMLSLERTFLNFLQRLSSISTATRDFINISGDIKVFDTRKTTPGFRELEKYATRIGGATNHRQNLSDQILLKNNHIDLAGESLEEVLKRIFKNKKEDIKVEVEVRDFNELDSTLKFPVDIIMLDNMNNEDIKKALEIINKINSNILVEVSGGINKERMPEFMKIGVKAVSTSKLITNARGVDISMRIF